METSTRRLSIISWYSLPFLHVNSCTIPWLYKEQDLAWTTTTRKRNNNKQILSHRTTTRANHNNLKSSSIPTSLRSKRVFDPNESSIPSLRSQQPSLLSQQAFDPKSSIPSLRPQVFDPKSLWSQVFDPNESPSLRSQRTLSSISSLWSQQVFDPNKSSIQTSLWSPVVFDPNKSSIPTSLRPQRVFKFNEPSPRSPDLFRSPQVFDPK